MPLADGNGRLERCERVRWLDRIFGDDHPVGPDDNAAHVSFRIAADIEHARSVEPKVAFDDGAGEADVVMQHRGVLVRSQFHDAQDASFRRPFSLRDAPRGVQRHVERGCGNHGEIAIMKQSRRALCEANRDGGDHDQRVQTKTNSHDRINRRNTPAVNVWHFVKTPGLDLPPAISYFAQSTRAQNLALVDIPMKSLFHPAQLPENSPALNSTPDGERFISSRLPSVAARWPALILLLAGLGFVAGCDEKEKFSRYPSVEVPGFETADYIRALSDPNPEIVYNAVCTLGASAEGLGVALGGEKANPSSREYQTAQTVYRRIGTLLESRDPHTVAASLRFLQLFSEKYKPKAELIAPVCNIASSHPLVQFEQVTLLTKLATESTRLPEQMLRGLVDSPSWIVSRSTHRLIGKLADSPLRQELLRRYRSTGDEAERLLLFAAIGEHPGKDEIALLQNETLTAASPKIRKFARAALSTLLPPDELMQWVVGHYAGWQPEEKEAWFNLFSNFKEEEAIEWVSRFIGLGYVPRDETLAEISVALIPRSGDLPAYAGAIDQAMRSSPQLAERWRQLQAEDARARERFARLQQDYAPLTSEFAGKARALLAQYGVPADQQEEFLKSIPSLPSLKGVELP